MIWNRSACGAPADVIDQAEQWGKEIDAANVAAEIVVEVEVRAGQQRQVTRVVEAVKGFADRCPDGYELRVTAGGFAAAIETDADHWYVNMGCSRSVATK